VKRRVVNWQEKPSTKPLMVSLSNQSGTLFLPFDKLRVSGEENLFIHRQTISREKKTDSYKAATVSFTVG
jgi:hypothetical protein